MNDIKTLKNEKRKHFKQLRIDYGEERRAVSDGLICRRIASLASFRYAEAVLLYAPLEYEVDVTAVAEEGWRSGKTICFPKCGERSKMDFHIVDSPEKLLPGAFGVSEPNGECPLFEPYGSGEGTVCIVPGLSFDRGGYRLGYGGGYYDRYLSKYKGTKIGVVYDELLSDELPRGRYDLRVDIIVTDRKIIAVGR
ncbi:MAG: 5-formyltetrahydrofolate cyclo-ligase [Clostridia bacterium]|nr:5-formyltetrahydrofolate cyclo-ligase [Clostridia bacterium]